MPVVADVAAERAVLAGICQYGPDLFLDITDMVKVGTFSLNSNQVLFKCLEHVCLKNDCDVDLPSILSAAKELGLDHILDRKEEALHLNSIIKLSVNRKNVRRFAAKIRRLEIARLIYEQGAALQDRMKEVDGTETVTELMGITHKMVLDFTELFDAESELKAKAVGEGIEEYLEYLVENPCEQLGISTGFPEFDESIGGGLHPGVTMLGARPKVGKTTLSINIARNIAEQGIPVLYMDTEMIEKGKYRDISDKMLAAVSDQTIKDIKTGAVGEDPVKLEKARDAAKHIKDLPFDRIDISGVPFEDQLYAMRRWVQSEVGLNADGTAKPCVIIYDYLKLMDSEGLNDSVREFQMLGTMMTALQNFGLRYAVPIVSFTQLNRDGIDGETSGVVAGSDRITWFCISFSILKNKSEDEVADDGPEMGNKKIVTILSRYGPGHDFGEYAHLFMDKYRAQIKEIDRDNLENFGDRFEVDHDFIGEVEVEDGEDAMAAAIPFD